MPDEKKIIIDEDWKSRVEAEKQAAQEQQAGPAAPDDEAAPAAAEGEPFDVGDVPMPPASFELLLTTLATEALVALGQVPHPASRQVQVHRNQAKYLIDTIDMLRQKAKGNLTPDEQQTIDGLLHQLRMAFIRSST